MVVRQCQVHVVVDCCEVHVVVDYCEVHVIVDCCEVLDVAVCGFEVYVVAVFCGECFEYRIYSHISLPHI